MSEIAQIIWVTLAGIAFVLLALTSVIWSLRCNPDKPNYRLPRLTLFSFRKED